MVRCKVLIVAGALLCGTAGAQDQRFENPPKEARPYVWWHWINGNTSKDGIRKDLEWMNRIGIVGFHQFDAGGSMMQGLPPVVLENALLSCEILPEAGAVRSITLKTYRTADRQRNIVIDHRLFHIALKDAAAHKPQIYVED